MHAKAQLLERFMNLRVSSPIYAGFYINAIRFILMGGFMTVDLHAKSPGQSLANRISRSLTALGGVGESRTKSQSRLLLTLEKCFLEIKQLPVSPS